MVSWWAMCTTPTWAARSRPVCRGVSRRCIQEGLRIPPTKLMRAGVLNEELVKLIMTNVRMPEQNWGDMKAQIASVNIGELKVKEIVERFGRETFEQGIEDLLSLADAQARRVIKTIPDGEYFFCRLCGRGFTRRLSRTFCLST